MPRPQSYDHLKSAKKTPVRIVQIPMDDELAAEWQEVQGKVELCKMRLQMGIDNQELKARVAADLVEAEEKMAAMKDEMEESLAVFKFAGIGRKRFEKLQTDNPITPEQAKEGRDKGVEILWNTETFPAIVIAATLREPKLTVEQVQEMWDSEEWTEAELLQLLQAALEVNQNIRNINWGKG